MANNESKKQQILEGKWAYACTLTNGDITFPKESAEEQGPGAFSHGGTISFTHLDDKVKIKGQREWRKNKADANTGASVKPINWGGEYAADHDKGKSTLKFEMKDLDAKFKGLQGVTRIVVVHDHENPSVRSGWFHYVPSLEFLAYLSKESGSNAERAQKIKAWTSISGAITMTKK